MSDGHVSTHGLHLSKHKQAWIVNELWQLLYGGHSEEWSWRWPEKWVWCGMLRETTNEVYCLRLTGQCTNMFEMHWQWNRWPSKVMHFVDVKHRGHSWKLCDSTYSTDHHWHKIDPICFAVVHKPMRCNMTISRQKTGSCYCLLGGLWISGHLIAKCFKLHCTFDPCLYSCAEAGGACYILEHWKSIEKVAYSPVVEEANLLKSPDWATKIFLNSDLSKSQNHLERGYVRMKQASCRGFLLKKQKQETPGEQSASVTCPSFSRFHSHLIYSHSSLFCHNSTVSLLHNFTTLSARSLGGCQLSFRGEIFDHTDSNTTWSSFVSAWSPLPIPSNVNAVFKPPCSSERWTHRIECRKWCLYHLTFITFPIVAESSFPVKQPVCRSACLRGLRFLEKINQQGMKGTLQQFIMPNVMTIHLMNTLENGRVIWYHFVALQSKGPCEGL